MLSLAQAIILGLLQGATELFPVSSLGHTVIIPHILGWQVNQSDPSFLSFIIATHLATAIVLFLFFWRDWFRIIAGIFRSLWLRTIETNDTYAKIGWLLVVSTVPAGILGVLFEKSLKTLFASPKEAALFLLCNGILLGGAEVLRRRRSHYDSHDDTRVARLSFVQAVKIGLLQCLALLPGFSRTGTTLAEGLLEGLSHEDAARYAFLLATPIIGAAAALELPAFVLSTDADLLNTLAGALCAAGAAYLSVRFLSGYFKSNTLLPFAIYCVVLGLLVVLL